MTLVSRYQQLTEAIIEALEDKVDWNEVFKNQNISERFIIKYIDKVSSCDALENKHLSEGVVNTIFKRVVLIYLGKICSKI